MDTNNKISDKIPKICHFYWDGSKMSYLHYMTFVSFNAFNSDHEIFIHTPKHKSSYREAWKTKEQTTPYTGEDFWEDVQKLPYVSLQEHDFTSYGIDKNLNEIHKSDILRWKLLNEIGGVWSDSDILYTHDIYHSMYSGLPVDNTICYKANYGNIIGFYISCKGNPLFKEVFRVCLVALGVNRLEYQKFGAQLLNDNMLLISQMSKQLTMFNMSTPTVYPFLLYDIQDYDSQIEEIFSQKWRPGMITEHTFGIHWYNGSDVCKNFLNTHNKEDILSSDLEIAKLIRNIA